MQAEDIDRLLHGRWQQQRVRRASEGSAALSSRWTQTCLYKGNSRIAEFSWNSCQAQNRSPQEQEQEGRRREGFSEQLYT